MDKSANGGLFPPLEMRDAIKLKNNVVCAPSLRASTQAGLARTPRCMQEDDGGKEENEAEEEEEQESTTFGRYVAIDFPENMSKSDRHETAPAR